MALKQGNKAVPCRGLSSWQDSPSAFVMMTLRDLSLWQMLQLQCPAACVNHEQRKATTILSGPDWSRVWMVGDCGGDKDIGSILWHWPANAVNCRPFREHEGEPFPWLPYSVMGNTNFSKKNTWYRQYICIDNNITKANIVFLGVNYSILCNCGNLKPFLSSSFFLNSNLRLISE